MTHVEFRLKYTADLKGFLNTECGKDLMSVLYQLRPSFVTSGNPHVHTESAGAVRGYELCLKTLNLLSELPKQQEEIEMDYGVSNKPTR